MFKKISLIRLFIAGVLILKAFLLLVGFSRYGAHPDELGSRLMDMVSWKQWRPFNYYYPTTHQYFLKLLTIPIADIGHFKLGLFPTYDVRLFDLIGRVISGLLAMGCSLLAYFIGRAAGYDRKTAFCFLLLFSSFPLLNNLGRYNTTDVPNLFWALLAILATLHAIGSGTSKWTAIAGLCAGMAVGVKFLGALFLPGLWLALVFSYIRTKDARNFLKVSSVWSCALIAGFIVSTPYAIIEPARLLSDLRFLSARVPVWSGTEQIIGGIGIPLQVISVLNPVILAFCVWGLSKISTRLPAPLHLILGVSAVTIYLFMFKNHFYPLRFVLPLYGVLLLMAGMGYAALVQSAQRSRFPILWSAVPVMFAVGVLFQFRASAAIAWNYYHETRYEAAQWLRHHIDGAETIAMPTHIDTYFPVPLLPAASIYDTNNSGSAYGSVQIPATVKYGLTSSFWISEESGPAEQFQAYMIRNWQLKKMFKIKPFLGTVPDNTEFLSPTISIYSP